MEAPIVEQAAEALDQVVEAGEHLAVTAGTAVAEAAHEGMGFAEVIMWVLAFGAIIGGLDLMFGNKFGLGEKFEEGFHAMGPLALAMVGIMCLAPTLADILRPIIVPVFTTMNAEPAAFAGLLPNDAGGYPLAMALAGDTQLGLDVAKYAGLLIGSMLGCSLGLLIPMALGMLQKWDQPYFAKGLLLGIIVIPFGSVVGGLIGGFGITMLFWNTLPILIISILLIVGLCYIPDTMIKMSMLFGKIIAVLVIIGLINAAFKGMTGEFDPDKGIDMLDTLFTKIGLAGILGVDEIAKMMPIMEAMAIIGLIGVVLLGTFPVMTLLIKVLKAPLEVIGSKLGLDAISTAGFIITLANPVPTLKMVQDMNSRGKILNCAFFCTSATALGDHLAYTAAMDNKYVPMVVLGKIISGVMVIVLGLMWTRTTELEDRQSEEIRKQMPACECPPEGAASA